MDKASEENLDDFENYMGEVAGDVINYFPATEKQKNVLNIIDFSSQILDVKLWIRQRFILKVFYNLPLDEEEKKEIQWLKENKGLEIPENYRYINFRELVLVAGRRGSKSLLSALIAAYEVYKLLNLENPQRYYGLISGTPIHVLHCAAEQEQAKIVQDFFKAFIKAEFFKEYIEHISEKEIRFRTDFDKNTDTDKGSIRFYSLTSNSASIPGRAAIMVILDEEARYMDTKGRLSGDQVYQALTPSIKDFKEYGKIINISSPLTKAGIFYDLYIKSQKVESMLAFQYATWELRPTITREDLQDEYEKNESWCVMEYGAEFGEVLDAAFDSGKIDEMIEDRDITYIGKKDVTYVITCDPATINDRYGVAWGHAEYREGGKYVIVDGMKYYESKKYKDESGETKIDEVDLDEADDFVVGLIQTLINAGCIAYDQGKSTASIQKLKKKNYNAVETTFTNKYKTMLYNDVKGLLNQGKIKVYKSDPQGAVNLLKDEMKHIEREIKGDIIKIGHPMFGPCVTDDLYDCVSNLSHILLEEDPKKITEAVTSKPRVVRTKMWG